MKKIISSLLALIMVVTILPAGIFNISAKAATSGYYTYEVVDGKATITDFNASISGAVTIPATLGGYPVTAIGSSAFRRCTRLTSITIPDSVTSIGNHAFDSCYELTSITIPDSVKSIGDEAFYWCIGLTSITIPDSVTNIGGDAFNGCSGLTMVNITDLAAWCNIDFYNSSSNPLYYAKKLYINGNLATEITIPDSVTSIGGSAFDGCSGLTSITIPDSVTSIGSSAFYGCSGLTMVNITDLAAWCNIDFSNYYSNPLCYAKKLYINGNLATEITIPDGVTSIGSWAFYGCSGLTSITIPDSVTSIGSSAFNGCSGLTSITIPDSVTSIGNDAFSGCSGLTMVNITDLAAWCNIDFSNYSSNPLDYAKELYINGNLATEITIPDGVTSIDSWAFYCCSGITSITIPNSVTSIGDYAFYRCSSLTSITIPDSVTSIGNDAFEYCSRLTSITIPDGVISIGARAFSNCRGLTSITIPDSVTSIGSSAFYLCSGLTSITIPDSVTSIGRSAFYRCSGLTSVTIPCSVTNIGDDAFYNCNNLTLYIDNENLYAIEYAQTNEIDYTTCHIHTYTTEMISYPTCTESGYAEETCTRCEYYDIIEIEALGHDYESVITEPTCTDKGYGVHTCTRCGDNKTNEIEALGHSYVLTDSLEPTCTEQGYNKYNCSECGDTKTEELETVDHIYKSTIVAPTCTEKGYTTHTCNCGDSYRTDYTDSLGGHNFVIKGDVIAPTLTEQGYTLYLCENCDATEKRNYTSYVLPRKILNVTVAPNDIGFNVTWDAVEYADGYYVRIREKDGSTNITNVNVKGTSYEFAIGKNGLSLDYDKEYTIQVIAQVGTSYQKWADADKVTSKMVVGNRVVGIKATEYRNGAQVTFRPVEGANKYWVFVRNAADDSSVYTTSTTTTSVNIINNMVGGTEYYVQIVAYADKALDSRANALKTKFVAPYVLPSTYNVAAKTPTTFSITWDAVAGADTYFVQVRDENDAPVRTVTSKNKTIAAVAMCSDGSKLSANTTYKFRIAATINGVTTGYGEWMTYTTGDYEAVTVNAEKAENKVKISWNDISDSHAVYLYKIDANGKRTYFKYLENGETSYTIKAPASGSYSYGVVTVQRNMSGDCYNPIAVSNTLTF